MVVHALQQPVIIGFFVAALALGVLMTLPIGGADMPVVISLYNALTGLAVAFEGYVLGIEALIIAGMVVGAAGTHADAADGQGDEPADQRRAVLQLRRRRRGAGNHRRAEAHRSRRRRRDDGLRRARGDRARLRPGRGAGAAQGLGTDASS